MEPDAFKPFELKMREAGMGEAITRAFEHSFSKLISGDTGLLPESTIQPVSDLPRVETSAEPAEEDRPLLAQVAVVKLNGGLGTSMGLDSPKSLLMVREGLTFLDVIANQILSARKVSGVPLRFLLMNSFSTSEPTLKWLAGHQDLGTAEEVEMMQNRIPKVDAATRKPAEWSANRALEWCPPGHGDLYPTLLGSGVLDRLLKEGVRYAFVSNSDNLGATIDCSILRHFAESDRSFLMEVCERSAADRKGGHLAQRNGQLLLRESAQCPKEDQAAFQDITRHRFFNTNNLWLRLDRLKELLDRNGGLIPLPVIQNSKNVNPRDPDSPKVIQLETAMGAAIECFEDAGAVIVPRARFAPVKTTADLLAVRSDAYVLTADHRVVLTPERSGTPPAIRLDPDHYKLVDQLDSALVDGVPSLKNCTELTIEGPVRLTAKNILSGRVTVRNASPAQPATLAPGSYADQEVSL